MNSLAPLSEKRGRFAFLVHPRTDVAADLATINPLLGLVPNEWIEKAFRSLPLKPRVQSTIRAEDTGEILGECIFVPLTPKQMLGRDRAFVNARMQDAVEFSRKRGATIIGLGALTATVTSGGKKLESLQGIGVTNGNAFTAAATIQGIRKVASGFSTPPVIALVGASGSVGAGVTQGLSVYETASELIVIGRNRSRLETLAGELGDQKTTISVDMADCRKADIIVLMTSATEALLHSEHLKQGAIVIDDTQPRNTSPDLTTQRPDITLIDGGLVMTPGLKRKGYSIGIPSNFSFACLAETALLALENHIGHGVIGNPTKEQVLHMQDLSDKHSRFGFNLAEPTSFGTPISVRGWNLVEAA